MRQTALAMFMVCGLALGQTKAADPCGPALPCCSCGGQCRIVMMTCQEIVYDEQEQIAYKTVYEEVVEEKPVAVVEYVPQTQYRCVPTTIMQPPAPGVCPPAASCAPCAPCATPELVPVQICQKVSFTGFSPVNKEKTVPTKRIVAKQVPYKVTVCIPKVVCKQVPVQVCTSPCCKCCRCRKEACAGTGCATPTCGK